MKMNLKINMAVSGNIVITHKSNRDNLFGSVPEKRNRDSRESIDLNGLQFDISMEENVEDITPKEYIQAVGSAMKDVVSGLFAGKCSCKEEQPREIKEGYEQYRQRIMSEHDERMAKLNEEHAQWLHEMDK